MICTKKYTCKHNNNKKKTIYETKTGKQKHNKVTKTEKSTKKNPKLRYPVQSSCFKMACVYT